MNLNVVYKSFRNLTTSAIKLQMHGAGRTSATAGKPGGMKMWRNLSMFVVTPSLALAQFNVYLHQKEEQKHFERPEFIPYSHLRIRTKRFPWGDGNHSFFHNPKVNPLPEGYEDELEGEGESEEVEATEEAE